MLLCTGACVRFRHLQRTRFQKLDEEFFFGECFKGKSREQGIRHGFAWAAPTCWGPGLGVLRGVGRLQCWLATSCKDFDAFPFVIPDMQIQGHGVAQGDVWLPSPIATGKFMRLVRVVLQEAGLAEEVGQYATDLKDFEFDAPLMFGLQFLIFVLPPPGAEECADFRSCRKANDCLL